MTIGERIKYYRKMAGLTQKQLGTLSKTSENTIRQYETGKRQPRINQLQKIAPFLHVSVSDLIGVTKPNNCFWFSYLSDKLKQVGCRLAFDEEDAAVWIEFPDGFLSISDKDLKELDDSTVAYLQFKLAELKKSHEKDFRPRKK